MTANNKTIKFLSSLIIILIIVPTVLFSRPKKVNAQLSVNDWLQYVFLGTGNVAATVTAGETSGQLALKIKSFATAILQQLVITAERQLLKTMTQDTVNWINTGFSGSPLFVQNPGSLFNDIGKTEIKNLVNTYGYDSNRYPFGQDFALNIINQYKQTAANNAQYTLSQAINDPVLLHNYQTNFNVGGWNGFLINTQYPQNNYLGFQMLATDQLASKLVGTVQNTAQKVQTTLQQGMGFLSPKTCATNPSYNSLINEFNPPTYTPTAFNPPPEATVKNYATNADATGYDLRLTPEAQTALNAYTVQWQNQDKTAYSQWAQKNTCINPTTGQSGLVVTTPGSVVANQITTALSSDFTKTELGGAVTGSISAILDSLVNHFIGSGLSALTSTINPPPVTDNFSYMGQTLSNSTINNTGGLTVSQNIYTAINSSGTATISGGTMPYSIYIQPDSTVANAKISGNTITVNGVGLGNTTVTINDSSSPVQTATTQIAVSNSANAGKLSINFDNPISQDVSVDTGDTANINLSGGTMPYSIQTQPDASVAGALISSDNTLTIVSLGQGKSYFVVQDSSGNNVTINITVNSPSSPDLSASQQNVSINVGTSINNITLSGGTSPYTIQTQPDTSVAQVGLTKSTLTVAGVAVGTTSTIIQDSSFPIKTLTIPITISAETSSSSTGSGAPLGTCNYPAMGSAIAYTASDITQTTCTANNGTWIANNTATYSTTPPVISSWQGYNATTKTYTNGSATVGQYLVLYGTFPASGNSVTIGNVAYNPTYQSTSQMNVNLIASSVTSVPTGVQPVFVFSGNNGAGSTNNSNTINVTINPASPASF